MLMYYEICYEQRHEINWTESPMGIKMKDVVLYHAMCTDGLFAAHAHYLKYGHVEGTDPTYYVPVGYTGLVDKSADEIVATLLGDIPGLDQRHVYILDFSFSPFILELMASKCGRVTLLDHHRSASDDFAKYYGIDEVDGIVKYSPLPNLDVTFDMSRSGAMMSFNHFFPDVLDENVPMYFQWVQDRDLWLFKYERTKDFAAGIRWHTADLRFKDHKCFQKLNYILECELKDVLTHGSVLVQNLKDRVNREKKNGYKQVWIAGRKMAFINAALDIASELGNSIVLDGNVDIAVIYVVAPGRSKETRSDLPKVLCSVRSTDYVDSLFFAKHFGGGGHAQANGCSLTLAQLNTILGSKGNLPLDSIK